MSQDLAYVLIALAAIFAAAIGAPLARWLVDSEECRQKRRKP